MELLLEIAGTTNAWRVKCDCEIRSLQSNASDRILSFSLLL
ncbi:hypothetical protein [Phormidium nigroviride]|nr:hypothetical protein [Oscillatoria nigro-viridis]